MRRPQLLVLALAAVHGAPALAQNLFIITATGGGNAPVTVGADSIIDLVDQAINTQGAFAPFENSDASFALNYGGVANAITVTKNAANTGATLTFGPTGVTRTFSGTSQQDLEDQIEAYLRENGGSDLADFLSAINAMSVIAVSDGNPNATTARMADYAYERFALHAVEFPYDRAGAVAAARWDGERLGASMGAVSGKDGPAPTLRVDAFGKAFDAGDFDGTSASIATSFEFSFNKSLGLSLGSFVGWHSIGDADVFHVAANAGVPVRLIVPDSGVPVLWQVTPSVTVGGSGSEDIGAGGLIWSVAVTSHLRWDINEQFSVQMANQFGIYEGETLAFSDFEIDPGVSQQIIKNGVKGLWRFAEGWHLYAGASYTNFLDDAAVQGYLTPIGGVGFTKAGGSGIEAGITGDFGDDYSSFGGRVGIRLAF